MNRTACDIVEEAFIKIAENNDDQRRQEAKRNKTASAIVEDSFEKIAALNLGAIAKTVGKGIKSLNTATKNLPNSLDNAKKLNAFAKNTNLSESTRNLAVKARNKQLGNAAKGMILPGTGIMGAAAIGKGLNNAFTNNNQQQQQNTMY